MSLYEGMFLLDSRQANRDWDGLMESLKALLTKHGAEVEREVKWGERKLAYEINGRRRGTYVLCYFNAPGEAITPIYREVELSDSIHRALILKVSKLPSDEELFIPTEGSGWRRGARSAAGRPQAAKEDSARAKDADEAKKVSEDTAKADQLAESPPEIEEAAKPEAASDVEEPKADAASSNA